ncbi:MAG: replication factor C large subunit [Candidatus Aenigmarchaeota archaeon]|nr:replication factor C large subunit [Candidatus Aenigmarchaeota archaeon]
MMLWTDKHKPKRIEELVGQKKAVFETYDFLNRWRPGEALLFHGPAGVGKTLLAEIAASERDWTLVQVNASDTRSGKDLEGLLEQSSRQRTLFHEGKLILIDEVDGISGHERGAAPSLLKIIKSSKFPMILIANDPWKPKLRPLRQHCRLVKFSRVPYPSIAKRLKEMAKLEGKSADDEVLKDLARWASGDMRSAVLDFQLLSTGKQKVTGKDLESLGFRERQRTITDVLPTLFFSGSLKASRKVIREIDKDPDEVFWWLESNLAVAYKDKGSLADGYELLAKADMFRSLVSRQQNWRFKAYMVDMLSGISLFKDDHHGFVPFKPPYRILMMGQTKHKRAMLKSLSAKLGEHLHVSGRIVIRDYLPLMRFLLRKGEGLPPEVGLSEDEIDAIRQR